MHVTTNTYCRYMTIDIHVFFFFFSHDSDWCLYIWLYCSRQCHVVMMEHWDNPTWLSDRSCCGETHLQTSYKPTSIVDIIIYTYIYIYEWRTKLFIFMRKSGWSPIGSENFCAHRLSGDSCKTVVLDGIGTGSSPIGYEGFAHPSERPRRSKTKLVLQ